MKRWLVLTVTTESESARELLAHSLVSLGGRAVQEEEGGALVTHLPEPEDPVALALESRERLRLECGDPDLEVSWRWQQHEDWKELWRQGLAPRRVTKRLIVVPSWLSYRPEPEDRVIHLDPGMAFGTAEHATTRACLRLLDPVVREGDRILDVGAGSGILSIAAALLDAREVLAVEVDPLACEAARENLEANGVADRVELREARFTPELLSEPGIFHGVLANLETGLLLPLLESLVRPVVPGGWMILAGILEGEANRVREGVVPSGFELEAEDVEDGWWSARFRRGGPGAS